MTETSPLAVLNRLLPKHHDINLSDEEKINIRLKQGRIVYGMQLRVVGDNGEELKRDGKQFGQLQVRGPWVTRRYFGEDAPPSNLEEDEWFNTGDVGTIDEDGYLQITDREKDVIKSGGEWISSIEVENKTMELDEVSQAAVIAAKHPRWVERPLLLVVKEKGKEIDKEKILKYLEGKVAKWWIPDDVLFVDELPYTATGKIWKKKLREMFGDRWTSNL